MRLLTKQCVYAFTSFEILSALTATVYDDSAANAVAVALRHNVAHDGRNARRQDHCPRQPGAVDPLWVGVHIKIADVRDRAHRTENLVNQRLRIRLAGARRSAFEYGRGSGATSARTRNTVNPPAPTTAGRPAVSTPA